MTDEQRQRDRAQLGAAIDSLSDSALKVSTCSRSNGLVTDCLSPCVGRARFCLEPNLLYAVLWIVLQTHMLTALRAFETSASSTQSSVVQQEKEKDDAIAVKLKDKSVTVHEPRDALFLAVHVLLLEAGRRKQAAVYGGRAGAIDSCTDVAVSRLQVDGHCGLGVCPA